MHLIALLLTTLAIVACYLAYKLASAADDARLARMRADVLQVRLNERHERVEAFTNLRRKHAREGV